MVWEDIRELMGTVITKGKVWEQQMGEVVKGIDGVLMEDIEADVDSGNRGYVGLMMGSVQWVHGEVSSYDKRL